MRLGLLGLGRIGEFHADTLASLPMVDSLVVADIIPGLPVFCEKPLARTLAEGAVGRVRASGVPVQVHGSRDSIAVGLEKKLPLRSVEPLARFPTGVAHRMFMDRFLAAYQAELEVFAELVAGDRRSPCCTAGEDGLEADLIAEACGLSLREHRPVRIEEVRP